MTARTSHSSPIPSELAEVPLGQFLIRQELPVLTEIVSANEADAIPAIPITPTSADDIAAFAAQIAGEISARLTQELPAMIESILRQKLTEPDIFPEGPEATD